MQVKRDNRTLHLSDLPDDAPDISIAISYVGDASINKAIALDKILLPIIEQCLQGDLLEKRLQDTAADCILCHEDDLVENLGKGYVTDPPTRATIKRWVQEDTFGVEKSPEETFVEVWTQALQARVDAILEEMEDQEMDNPTEDDFRAMVKRVGGYA